MVSRGFRGKVIKMEKVYLYGPPASGKSTLGLKLSAALGASFVDLDSKIESVAGKSIPDIFREEGESAFRKLESSVLESVAGSLVSPAVVSLGGGTLLSRANRDLCERTGAVICLDAPSQEEIARRIAINPASRPLGDKAVERAEHYASFPGRIAGWFELEGSLVVVGCDIAAAMLKGLRFASDATVKGIYEKDARFADANIFGGCIATVPSGEIHKTLDTVSSLWSAFAVAGIGRKDLVGALGGGVTGDLTGFAAATWMRGVDWVNVPTTLLSMVDASSGGKTGCDLPEGKNLAGAFHSPKLVVVDTSFLRTLSPDVLSDGRAEMIKHEIIRALSPASEAIPSPGEIAANLKVKIDIVRDDPLERNGRRMLLNCGHTVGHAVEKLSGYALSHGKCVAIGCVEEARIAVRRSLADPSWPEYLARRFASAGLPTELPSGMRLEDLSAVMKGDKKRRGDIVDFALPCALGDVRIVPIDLSKEEL